MKLESFDEPEKSLVAPISSMVNSSIETLIF